MALYGSFKYGAKKYGKQAVLTASFSLVDTKHVLTSLKAKVEVILLVATAVVHVVFLEVLSEAITLVSSLGSFSISKVIINAVTLVDDISSFLSRRLNDTIVLVDIRINQAGKLLINVFSLVDTVIKMAARTLFDVFSLVDSVITLFNKLFTEIVTLVDDLKIGYFRIFIERIFLKQFFEAIMNGLVVGLWRKVARHVADWTKREQNL